MGTSTDAELFYGYVWQVSFEESEGTAQFEDFEGDDAWQEKVLEERGFSNPWARYEELTVPKEEGAPEWQAREFTETGRMLVDQWYKLKRDVEDEFGVEFFTHGGPEWRCPAIAVKRTHTKAWRGTPVPIDWESMSPGETWNAELDAWMAAAGVVLDQDTKGEEWDGPGWFLVSDWTY